MEKWKWVPGYRNLYQVSDQGRVRSFSTHKVLVTPLDKGGYPGLKLYKYGEFKNFTVATLVTLAFLGKRQPGLCVRHLNGIRDDSRLINLAYGTYSDNQQDRVIHGTMMFGEDNKGAKLTNKQAIEIRNRYTPWCKNNGGGAMSREFGVTSSTIRAIAYGKSWKSIK